ncbi:MAG: biotin/lipoyl-binding protein, partial [Muribaculaceae bacterium]|nr:biotin/lipoyl-binding protein [Muribaculaceae bacterium]
MKKSLYSAVIVTLTMTACHNTPDYDATGIFEATTVTVSAETAGKILSLTAEEGDSVIAGQKIAVVDTSILVLQQKQLGSQQQSAKASSPDIAAQAAALRSQIAHQEHECQRFGRLLADGATTQKQYDDAQAQLGVLRGQLTALLSTLD